MAECGQHGRLIGGKQKFYAQIQPWIPLIGTESLGRRDLRNPKHDVQTNIVQCQAPLYESMSIRRRGSTVQGRPIPVLEKYMWGGDWCDCKGEHIFSELYCRRFMPRITFVM